MTTEFGVKVNRYLKDAGYRNQKELASALNVHESTLSKWLHLKSPCPPEDFDRLCDRLGLNESQKSELRKRAWIAGQPKPPSSDPEPPPDPVSPPVRPRHNLPRPFHSRLIGCSEKIQEILDRLNDLEAEDIIVSLEGIGGVGKTALALEVAWYYVKNYKKIPSNEQFWAIVYASGRPKLIPPGLLPPSPPRQVHLSDLYRCIASVLDPAILYFASDQQQDEVDRILRQRRVLLILDDLDTMSDPDIWDFLYSLSGPSKVIVTARSPLDTPHPIRVKELDDEAAHELLLLETGDRGILLSEVQINTLLDRLKGLPLAIRWAVGLMKLEGMTPQDVIDKLIGGDLLARIFGKVVTSLKQKNLPAYHVLLTFSFFPSSASSLALACTAGVDEDRTSFYLNYLKDLNLVKPTKAGTRFAVLPLTYYYMFAELSAMPEWEREASQRWIGWYAELTQEANQSRDNLKLLEYELENIWAVIRWLDSQLDSQEEMQRLADFVTNVYYYLYQEGYWDKLQPLFEKCMTWAIEEENTHTAANLLALTYIAEEKDMATKWLDDLEPLAIRCNDELLLAHVNLEKGRLLYNEDKFEMGITCLEAALEVFRRARQLKRTVETLVRLGHAYRRRLASSSDRREKHEFYRQALHYYSQAKDLAATCTDRAWRKEMEVSIMLSIATAHYLAGRLREARDILDGILNDLSRPRSRATAYITLAVVEHRLGNVERAGELGKKGEELIDRLRLTRPIHFADKEWLEIRGEYGIADSAISA